MQADTSMWNMGLVRPTLSDWGAVDHAELRENNDIQRGLLYDHAFASWSTRSTSSKTRLPQKIFTAHTSSIPHAVSIPAHTPSRNTSPQCPPVPHTPSILAHTVSRNTLPQHPPVPLFDAASTSTVTSQLDVSPASAPPPNSSVPSRGGRGAGGRGRRGRGGGGRKSTVGRQGTTETTTGEVSSPTAASGQPSNPISSCLRKRALTGSAQDTPADNPPKRLARYVPKVHIKPKDVVQSLQVDVAGYGSRTMVEDLECFADKGGIYELTVCIDDHILTPMLIILCV